MKDNKLNKISQVTVNGTMIGQFNDDGSESQTFLYHVNITDSDNARSHEYDRELRILVSANEQPVESENSQPENIETSTAELVVVEESPSPAMEQAVITEINPESWTDTPLEITTESIENSAPKTERAEINQSNPVTRPSKQKSLSTRFKLKKLKLPPLRFPVLPNPAKWAVLNIKKLRPWKKQPSKAKRERTGSVKTFYQKLCSGTNLKSFSIKRVNGKGLIKFCVPCILLTVTAIIIYYTQKSYLSEKTISPVSSKTENRISKPVNGYHAVVEKTREGVVITLQGPEYDEVLTKLPPGYDPVIEGNKIVHVVTPGNTLWFIAMRYIKNPYRYPELARLNNIKNPDLIYPGEKVIIQYIKKP